MGTGISMAAMNAGFDVIMIEQNQEAIKKAFDKINSTYDRNVNLGRMTTDQKSQIINLFKSDTDMNVLNDRDLITVSYTHLRAHET